MIDWYLHTHAWNRIALIGVVAALVAKAVLSTLTASHMIGLPAGAMVFWACGWAAIAAWDIVCRQLSNSHQLRTADLIIENET